MAIVARNKAAAAVWDPECGCHLSDAGFTGQRAVSAKGYSSLVEGCQRHGREDEMCSSTASPSGAGDRLSTGEHRSQRIGHVGRTSRGCVAQRIPEPGRRRTPPTTCGICRRGRRKDVAALFGLPDVVLLDLRTRLTGGAVADAIATSSSGQTSTISGEVAHRVGAALGHIARSAIRGAHHRHRVVSVLWPAAVGRRWSRRRRTPASSRWRRVGTAASAYVVGGSGPARCCQGVAAGEFADRGRRVPPHSAESPVLSSRRCAGYCQADRAVDGTRPIVHAQRPPVPCSWRCPATPQPWPAPRWVRARRWLPAGAVRQSRYGRPEVGEGDASRSIVVVGKKELSNADARLCAGRSGSVPRTQWCAPRHRRTRAASGEAILVDNARVMAAAAAAASRRPVLFVAGQDR